MIDLIKKIFNLQKKISNSDKLEYKSASILGKKQDLTPIPKINITQQILELIKSINIKFDKKNNEQTTKEIHTLKHLLLYADLDEISDMCQELENDMRVGIFNHQLKEKIVSKIVK